MPLFSTRHLIGRYVACLATGYTHTAAYMSDGIEVCCISLYRCRPLAKVYFLCGMVESSTRNSLRVAEANKSYSESSTSPSQSDKLGQDLRWGVSVVSSVSTNKFANIIPLRLYSDDYLPLLLSFVSPLLYQNDSIFIARSASGQL